MTHKLILPNAHVDIQEPTTQSDLELQLAGYGLLTAEVVYRMPDRQSLLQTFLYQDYDLAPDMPNMKNFLRFWQENLDGPLHSVRYSLCRLVRPTEWRALAAGNILFN